MDAFPNIISLSIPFQNVCRKQSCAVEREREKKKRRHVLCSSMDVASPDVSSEPSLCDSVGRYLTYPTTKDKHQGYLGE